MTAAWATDIHLDHVGPEASAAFAATVRASGASALLLDGDIALATDIDIMIVGLAEMGRNCGSRRRPVAKSSC